MDGGGGGTLTCPELFDCIAACAEGDDPCVDACIARATPTALEDANALADCANMFACADEDCITMNCAAEVLECAGTTPPPDGGVTCGDGAGWPELTGPLTGLAPSYASPTDIDVSFPVDEDTVYARLTVYDYDTTTTLIQNWAETVTPGSIVNATIGLAAGVPSGTYYLTVELCSTDACALPVSRNDYERDGASTDYYETRYTNPTAMREGPCPTAIPIQTFTID
jgi:hypothetical protein